MNNKYKISHSKIHGLGVIATKDIKKGELIDVAIKFKLLVIPHITPHFGSMINHRQNANTELIYLDKQYYVTAKHNIHAGEEITINYNHTPWYIEPAKKWYKN